MRHQSRSNIRRTSRQKGTCAGIMAAPLFLSACKTKNYGRCDGFAVSQAVVMSRHRLLAMQISIWRGGVQAFSSVVGIAVGHSASCKRTGSDLPCRHNQSHLSNREQLYCTVSLTVQLTAAVEKDHQGSDDRPGNHYPNGDSNSPSWLLHERDHDEAGPDPIAHDAGRRVSRGREIVLKPVQLKDNFNPLCVGFGCNKRTQIYMHIHVVVRVRLDQYFLNKMRSPNPDGDV